MVRSIEEVDANYRIHKNSSVIISFIGLAFILLAGINYSFDIPSEHIIGVSFAAFFFVLADFSIMRESREKSKNEKLHFFLLLLAVMSFILLPILIPLFSINNKWLATASESLSIASLGIVLVMMNLKMWKAEEEYFNEFHKLNIKTMETLENYQTEIKTSRKQTNDAIEMAERSAKIVEDSNLTSARTLETTEKLIKIIEDGKTIEEVREKIKSI